jgi:hypothetical protein
MAGMAVIGRNRRGTGAALKALQAGGQLEGVDEGLVAMARATADLFDGAIRSGEKHYAIAAIGRLHLSVLLAVMGRMPEPVDSDGSAELLAFLNSPAVLGFEVPDGRVPGRGDAREDGGYRLPGQRPPWERSDGR